MDNQVVILVVPGEKTTKILNTTDMQQVPGLYYRSPLLFSTSVKGVAFWKVGTDPFSDLYTIFKFKFKFIYSSSNEKHVKSKRKKIQKKDDKILSFHPIDVGLYD